MFTSILYWLSGLARNIQLFSRTLFIVILTMSVSTSCGMPCFLLIHMLIILIIAVSLKLSRISSILSSGGERTISFSYKDSAHRPENRFSRALESRFLVPKNESQCSYFHLIGTFSWDMDNFISNILHFVKKWWPFYWLSHCKYLR